MTYRLIPHLFLASTVALVMMLAPDDAAAQATERDHAIHLGVTGGVNNPWIIYQNNFGERELDYEMSFRPGFGLQVGYQLREGFGFFREGVGVRTGVRYTQLGQEYEDHQGENYRRLTYLQIPFLVNLRFGAVDQGFYLQTGPQLGLLQNADVARFGVENPSIPGADGTQRQGTDLFNSTDWSWSLEFGPYFGISERAYLNIGLRSMISLGDINHPTVRYTDPDGEYEPSRNASVGVHVGFHYFFPFRQ